MQTGRKTASTTVSALATTEVARGNTGIQIYADSNNDAVVYIGFRNTITSDDDDDTDGFPIPAGESILLPIANPNNVYLLAASGSQKIWWMTV